MKENLEGIWQFFEGKKTYIAAAVTIGLSAATMAGVAVPTWVIFLAVSMGLITARQVTSGVDNYYYDEVSRLQAELNKLKSLK